MNLRVTAGGMLAACLMITGLWSCSVGAGNNGQVYTETREPCSAHDTMKQPYFGDLHVHTRYSLDASTQGTRTSPDQAYRFARGEALGVQPWDGNDKALRSLQLSRPLDFAMVSDHAELIGEVMMCNSPEVEGYGSWQCGVYRNWPRVAYYLFNFMATIPASHMGQCGDDDELCRRASLQPWAEMQAAAEAHYDRSGACRFTTFVGYEWTGMSGVRGGNLHRNVVFRTAEVPVLPASFIDEPTPEELWASLDDSCNGKGEGCDSLIIPHNSNLSAGAMYTGLDSQGGKITSDYAKTMLRFEPLAEIMQHKGASECYFEAGVTADELCAFEQLPWDNIAGLPNEPRPDTGFLRQVLREGLALETELGVNPYQVGVIASTDTHLGTPGAADENRFLGHGGAGMPSKENVPPGLPDLLEYNPGGLAVLWAEENSRDALFEALRRKETYGTSGPRIVSRFFAGWDYSQNLCESPDLVAQAYAGGVAMGGELVSAPAGAVPSFAVFASQDAGTSDGPGMPLQRIQIIKGWLDKNGEQQERVVDVIGQADNGASVDTRSCVPSGPGHAELCTVWRDEAFKPDQRAYYYSRVIENPSCRWSQRICAANGVDCSQPETIGEGLEGCCAVEHRPVVQERAWSSPIWYKPAA
jgi:uncharacterized protein DUF3604